MPRRASLSSTTLLIIGAIVAVGTAANFLVQRAVVDGEVKELERSLARSDAHTVVASVWREVEDVQRMTRDYGRWDDTCEFLADRNQDYIRSNFLPTQFVSTPITLAAICDTEGRFAFCEARSEEDGSPIVLAEFAGAGLPPDHPLLERARRPGGFSGILASEAGPLLIAAYPVTATDGKGPVLGTMIRARRFSDEVRQQIEGRLGVGLRLTTHDTLPLVLVDAARESFASGEPVVFSATGGEVTVVASIADVLNRDEFVLVVTPPRNVSVLGVAASRLAALLQAVIGIILGWVILSRLRSAVVRPVSALSSAVRDVAGSCDRRMRVPEDGPREISTLGRDINQMLDQLGSAESDLIRARDAAEAAAESKTRFLAAMSHETRTPMIGIMGMTEILLETDLSAEQRDAVSRVQRSSEVLLGVLNDVIDYSAIEQGQLQFASAPFAPRDAAELACDVIAWTAHAKGIEVVCDVVPGVPAAVVGDAQRIRQALLNLTSNAVKFTSSGRVEVQVAREVSAPAGTTGAEPDDGESVRLRFSVRDTGIGISEADRARLFQAFTQLDDSNRRRFSGTGLGLAIVRELVTRMGGRLGVESTPGAGACFWFSIPFRLAAPLEPAGAPRPADPLRLKRFLVCGGSAAMRRSVVHATAEWGAEVVEAANENLACAIVRDSHAAGSPFDAAILVHDRVDPGFAARFAESAARACPALVRLLPNGFDELRVQGSWTRADLPVRHEQLADRTATALRRAPRPHGDDCERTATQEIGPVPEVLASIEVARPIEEPALSAAAAPLPLIARRPAGPPVVPSDGVVGPVSGPRRAISTGRGSSAGARTVTSAQTAERKPRSPSGASGSATASAPAAQSARPMVLLAEDNATNAQIVTMLLERRGFAVSVACNGSQAVEAVLGTTFDAILMDCHMPVMDGVEAVRQIRAMPGAAPLVPIIALTANALAGERDRCISLGFDDYVSKPFNVPDLDLTLRRAIDLGRERRAAAAAPVADGVAPRA